MHLHKLSHLLGRTNNFGVVLLGQSHVQALDYRPVPGFERAEIGVKLVIEVDSFTVFAWSVLLFLRKKNVLDILVEFQPEVKRSVPQSLNESQHGCRQQLLVSL